MPANAGTPVRPSSARYSMVRMPVEAARNLIVVGASACGCAARPQWCRPTHQHRRCPMPTADRVRTPGTFGISAWPHRSDARTHPMCRWERTHRDPRRDRLHGHASPCPRRPVAAGEGLGSCHSSDHATFLARGRARHSSPLSRPGYPSVSRGWPPAINANAHRCPLLARLAQFLLAATRGASLRPAVSRHHA